MKTPPNNTPPAAPEPWPMKWIVLALLPCLAAYTFVTLQYRKPGHAFEPYNDLKARAQIHQLLEAGFQRIPLEIRDATDSRPLNKEPDFPDYAENPANKRTLYALITRTAEGGLPENLAAALIEPPHLIRETSTSLGPADLHEGGDFVLKARFYASAEPVAAQLYVHGNQIFLVVELAGPDAPEDDFDAEHVEYRKWLIAPKVPLKPGRYTGLLIGAEESMLWGLKVYEAEPR
ncbi:hypothetical protein [Cephaloticoccus capnophilus]|nr:hypothetical protein [Cephaloticoccus capnophilus]